MATGDMFLKLDTIDGESQDSTHTNEIQILSFSTGWANQGSGNVGMGSGTSKVNPSDFSFTHYVDKASYGLFNAVCTGKTVGSAKITIRKAGGDSPVEYLVYDLTEVFVSSVQTSGSDGGGLAIESFSLNYAACTITYTLQNADGTAGAAVPKSYNFKTGVAS